MVNPCVVGEGPGRTRIRRSGAVLGDAPAHLGQRPGAGGRLARLRARGGAVLDALGDALQDGGHAEQVVGEVEVPVGHHRVGVAAAGALAVAAHVLASRRDAERREVEAADAAERAPGGMCQDMQW